ncbi:hypothetical protein AB4090_06280 [Acidithiobacillus sp. IBUN Pt1247-S3]|uniref:hypothetical protein n=1 Tax=Acidithiobacillus sp. IBUN Pt1247-S3 TaxID=3166642 RepID=UPI0034E59446
MSYTATLNTLAQTLRQLHKALVEAEARNYGPAEGPYQLLQLLAYDPHFAWLHCLSEVMVDIDELGDAQEPVTDAQARATREVIELLVGPRAPARPAFRERYIVLMQQSPEVVMAHAELRNVLATLPRSAPTDHPE